MVARPHPRSYMAALGWLVTFSMVAVPLAVRPDLLDRFHVIKESLSRATALIGALIVVVAVALAGSERLREILRERAVVILVAAGVLWTAITAALSTNRMLSIDSFASVLTSALLFLVVWYAAPRIPLLVLDLLVPVVLINAALAYAQEHAIYDPFVTDDPTVTQHLKATGLIGNPNVVGSFMALASVILAGAAMRTRGVRRWLYAAGALCAVGSVMVSETRTALIALAAGLVLLGIGGSWKRALVFVVAVAVLFGAGVAARVPVVMSVLELPRLASQGTLEVATSGRVAPTLAALEMFRDRALIGVGPGAYRFQFMPYKTRVMEEHAGLVRGTSPTMFGEAHNDHLQMLAEVGLPGYLLFVAFVAAVCLAARRAGNADARQRVARIVALPLAGAFLVLCLAQFPLHLAVTRHLLVVAAGLMMGWSGRWE